MLPEASPWTDVVKVINTDTKKENGKIFLAINSLDQDGLCYIGN